MPSGRPRRRRSSSSGTTSPPERLLALGDLKTRGPRAAAFAEARDAVVSAALEELAARDRELLQELLTTFAAAYAAAKERESAVDFEDLQLKARDLLRDDEPIRERERLRFRSIMVDEFQDTNRLQTELLDLLCDGTDADLFVVGDEFQSIYGFRHADVAVFRERRSAAPTVLPLTRNHRSRPEVLAAVNELFGGEFGDEFQRLEPADEADVPALRNAFELLVTDKAAAGESGVHWRRSEARHVARRVRELVDAGVATPGEIVLLFAAGTDAEWFEEELRAVGLPTYRAAGRNYFGQQQVTDLLAYLRLLHNRYDDEALLTVLASPFVGVSNDTLVLIRAEAQRQPVFRSLERPLPGDLSEDDRRLLLAFKQRYQRLLDVAAHASLELLCERVLAEHDYDLAILALPDGRRRYANLRKLARLARSYEELRGADIEGFVRFVEGQEAVGAKESDAVSEEEGADAIRLLTIHAAKGLEFKVVVVADAGRNRPPVSDILALSDGRFGFKVAHPATGTRVSTASYQDVKAHRERAEQAERLRLYYVAMTRAKERLIVSGSVGDAADASDETPIGWVLNRLGLRDEARNPVNGPVEVERGAATVLLRVDRGQPDPAPASSQRAGSPARGRERPAGAVRGLGRGDPAPGAPPAGARRRARSAAPARLAALVQRALAVRALLVPLLRRAGGGHAPRAVGAVAAGGGGLALHATEVGDAVHRLLERVDLARPTVPEDLDALVHAWYPAVTESEVEHVARHVRALLRLVSCRAHRSAGGRAGRAAVRVRARRSPHERQARRALALGRAGARPRLQDERARRTGAGRDRGGRVPPPAHRLRPRVLRRRAGRGGGRLPVPRGARGGGVRDLLARRRRSAWSASSRRSIARIREGDFRPTPSAFACSGCPALDRVCAGAGARCSSTCERR